MSHSQPQHTGDPKLREEDITQVRDRLKRTTELARCYCAYAKINEAILHAQDRASLFEITCRTLVEIGPFRLALIGIPDSEMSQFSIAASFGEVASIATDLQWIIDQGKSYYMPIQELFQGRALHVQNRFDENRRFEQLREFFERNSLRSNAVFSLRNTDRLVAGLSIYATEYDYFHPEMLEILRNISENLAYALWNLDQDRRKQNARAELQLYRDRLESLIAERTSELEEKNLKLKDEIEYRENIQQEMRREEVRLATLLLINQMTNASEKEVIDFALEAAARLTNSHFGYVIWFGEESDNISLRVWNDGNYEQYQYPKPVDGQHVPEGFSEEILAACLERNGAVIHNNLYSSDEHAPCFPREIEHIKSHINVPVFFEAVPVAILGVANKADPYIEPDASQLSLLIHGVSGLLERKRSIEELKRVSIKAEAANMAKSEFLANMSHEIRTPLNGVIGLADLLGETSLDRKQLEYVQHIKASGKSLLSLVNDVLDFSNIETGKLELENLGFNFREMLESVLGTLAGRASEKNLELCITIDPGTPCEVRGDSVRLRQIFLHLLDNAIKFTEHGGVRIRVKAEEFDEDMVIIRSSVEDTGIGIPAGRIDDLFASFSPIDASSAKRFGGIGMGLALSQRLLDLMGSRFEVESIEEKGTKFSFAVRLLRSENPLLRERKDAGKNEVHWGDTFTPEGARTLLVDDNNVQREALCEQLNLWRIPVEATNSRTEAIRLISDATKTDNPFKLAIIDSTICKTDAANAPLSSGLELAREIKHIYSELSGPEREELAVILLAPLHNTSDSERIREAGVAVHLGKPVFGSALFDAISLALFHENPDTNLETASPETSETLHTVGDRPVRILVAEDNKINQIVVREILTRAGLGYEIVANGLEAFNKIEEKGELFDLILMDCQMPEMDGYEATRKIRELEKERDDGHRIPIVALTANATKGDKAKCIIAGMDAYCSKPVDAKRLLGIIDAYLFKMV